MNAITPIASPAPATFVNARCEVLRLDCLKVDETPPFERYKFTVDDIRALIDAQLLGETARIELIDGDIIAVPHEGGLHLTLKMDLTRYFVAALPPELGVLVDATMNLAKIDAPDADLYVVEPGTGLEPVDPRLVPLVIEIAVTSRAYDLGDKAAIYARHGLTEYWVIDAKAEVTHVFRNPRAGAYEPPFEVAFDAVLTAERLPTIALRISDLPHIG